MIQRSSFYRHLPAPRDKSVSVNKSLSNKIFPNNILLAALFALAIQGVSSNTIAGQSLHEGDTAPNWILATSQGETISFYQDSVGKKSIVLFWASWCSYCAELMPKLEALQNELNDSSIQFYALNIWEDGDALVATHSSTRAFTFLLNADMVAKRYNVQSTPGVYVVGNDRKIQYVRKKDTGAEQIYQEIKSLLEQK